MKQKIMYKDAPCRLDPDTPVGLPRNACSKKPVDVSEIDYNIAIFLEPLHALSGLGIGRRSIKRQQIYRYCWGGPIGCLQVFYLHRIKK